MQGNRIHKFFFAVAAVFFLQSCEYFTFEKKQITSSTIAEFDGKVLLIEDVLPQLPKNLNKNDSIIFVKRMIDNWALQQILVKKAELNNSQEINSEIQKLVTEYRQSLLINRYKEELIQQELDTVITQDEIDKYYESNKQNFRLSEVIIQLRYLTFAKDLTDRKDITNSFKRGGIENLEDLESKQLSFKQMMLNDSTWLSLNNVLKETSFYQDELLKKSQLVQKEDSINLFLAFVTYMLPKNEIAPKDYVKENIKAILLHRRKIEVIREIEKILLKDAIKEKQLIYK